MYVQSNNVKKREKKKKKKKQNRTKPTLTGNTSEIITIRNYMPSIKVNGVALKAYIYIERGRMNESIDAESQSLVSCILFLNVLAASEGCRGGAVHGHACKISGLILLLSFVLFEAFQFSTCRHANVCDILFHGCIMKLLRNCEIERGGGIKRNERVANSNRSGCRVRELCSVRIDSVLPLLSISTIRMS